MKGLLRKIYHLNKKAYYEYATQHQINPVTGLSPAERMRLQNFEPLHEGATTFFGKEFYFTDAGGFLHSVDEILGQEIYKFSSEKENPYIVDCGANMGLSILYFKKIFPKARILAFEPDENTFKVLTKNTSHFGESVVLKKKAVWTEDTELAFFSEGSLAGSVVVDFANKNNVTKVQATDLKKYLNEEIDFLKIDIEGAENQLIFDLRGHLSNIQNLFLEYHGILNEEQNLDEILKLLKEEGFQYYIRLAGETMKFPFCNEAPKNFNQQLNILCYRNR